MVFHIVLNHTSSFPNTCFLKSFLSKNSRLSLVAFIEIPSQYIQCCLYGKCSKRKNYWYTQIRTCFFWESLVFLCCSLKVLQFIFIHLFVRNSSHTSDIKIKHISMGKCASTITHHLTVHERRRVCATNLQCLQKFREADHLCRACFKISTDDDELLQTWVLR